MQKSEVISNNTIYFIYNSVFNFYVTNSYFVITNLNH